MYELALSSKEQLYRDYHADNVLILCSNEYYGGLWASFNLEGLQKWLEECIHPVKLEAPEEVSAVARDGERLIKVRNQFPTVSNIEETWYIAE